MHPSSILSYYPTYSILDEAISLTGCDTLNIFIDLKNNLQSIYMQHTILNIIENSLKSKNIDTSVFSSLIAFLAFHKMYSIKRNIKINYYVFFESGVSYYHTNISKKYKVNRKIDDLYGLEKDKRDFFFDILQKNYTLVERACNKLPDVKVLRLQNLEADFIPYYLITRKLISDGNVANIVYSNDHDMYQCINDNTFVFSKTTQNKRKLIKKGEVLKHYLKFEKNYPDSYLPLIMSVIGDPGDSVDGVKGIGSKRIEEIIEELVSAVGGMETLFDNVMNGKPIFVLDQSGNQNKYMSLIQEKEEKEGVISRNLKLVSFEILSRILDNPPKTEYIDKRNHICEILNDCSEAPIESMRTALGQVGVYLQEEDLDTIYYRSNQNAERE